MSKNSNFVYNSALSENGNCNAEFGGKQSHEIGPWAQLKQVSSRFVLTELP